MAIMTQFNTFVLTQISKQNIEPHRNPYAPNFGNPSPAVRGSPLPLRGPPLQSTQWIGKDSNPPAEPSLYTIRMRGLPYEVTYDEISDFFKGYDAIDESVTFGYNSSGRLSGEAYIQFRTPQDARRAIRDLSHQKIGRRYIELFPTIL